MAASYTKCTNHPFQKHSSHLVWVAGPERLAWEQCSREMVLRTFLLLDICLQPLSPHKLPTKKIILDRIFTFMACLSFFLIAVNYPLRASLSKIWSCNHKDIRRDNSRSKLSIIKAYLERKVAFVMKGMRYFPVRIRIRLINTSKFT